MATFIQPMPGAAKPAIPVADGARLPTPPTQAAEVHFPHTGNDNPARRITSAEHTDSRGWTWRLVLHPWGHDARGCYSAFLELANPDALEKGFSRYVKLEFAMHAWDAAYHVEPNKTQFLLHKFNAQATDFGYTRAFEHDVIMAQRTKFIDPQGYVRISVKIIDVREAYFRVATDADLTRSITGRGGGGDFADWAGCLPAKSFKHDQLLYVIQKVAELTAIPLVSCRPWLCIPRPGGAIRPVAALLPQHLQMTIREALGERPQYHIYLEEVDSLPEVWERRRSIPGELPEEEAGKLLLTGRAYAQLPNEVYLVFLKMDRRILLAHARNEDAAAPTSSGEPEFVFIGKAMAHKSDRGCELVPIARSLAHLPDTAKLEVFEQLAPEEVRRFSGEKTVEQAGLTHGSVLLFRSSQAASWPSVTTAPIAPVSTSIVPDGSAAAATAETGAISAAAASATPEEAHVAAGSTQSEKSGASAPAATNSSTCKPAGGSGKGETPSGIAAGADDADHSCSTAGDESADGEKSKSGLHDDPKEGGTKSGQADGNKDVRGSVGAPGWESGAGGAPAAAGANEKQSQPVVMDAEAQKRATYLALYQVQESARQRQMQETAKAVAHKLAAEAALITSKENFKKIVAGSGTSASKRPEGKAETAGGHGGGEYPPESQAKAVAAVAAAAAAYTASRASPLTQADKAVVAAAARLAAAAAAAKHHAPGTRMAGTALPGTSGNARHDCRTVSIKEALSEGAPQAAAAAAEVKVNKEASVSAKAVSTGDVAAVTSRHDIAREARTRGSTEEADEKGLDTSEEKRAIESKKKKSSAIDTISATDTTRGERPAGAIGKSSVGAQNGESVAIQTAAKRESASPKGRNESDAEREANEETVLAAATPATLRSNRSTRAGRAETGRLPAAGETVRASEAPVTSTPPVEQQRRSSRKAAAAAAQQMRCSARAASRGGGGGSGSAGVDSSQDGSSVPSAGSTASVGDNTMVVGTRDRRKDTIARNEANGVDEVSEADTETKTNSGVSKSRAPDADRETIGLKRGVEGREGGPRKQAKTAGDAPMEGLPSSIFSASDLSSLLSQLKDLPNFTFDKYVELIQSQERIAVAEAIATAGDGGSESLRSRQIERFLAIRENSTVGGGGSQ